MATTVARCSTSSAFAGRTLSHRQATPLSLPARSAASSVVVRAEAPRVSPPSGVSTPTQLPVVPPPAFGFVNNAEVLNSRACMIGFFLLIIIEAITGHGLLETAGFTVGEGLPFEL